MVGTVIHMRYRHRERYIHGKRYTHSERDVSMAGTVIYIVSTDVTNSRREKVR